MFANNPMVVSEVQTIVGLCDKCNISAFHPKDGISFHTCFFFLYAMMKT